MIRLNEQIGGVPIYQLKIVLRWSKPPIWRRILVRADMRLDRLHDVLQRVMPWTNSHLHQFIVGKTFYGVPDPDYGDMGAEMLDEKRYKLVDLALAAKKKFIYEYDFGDGWQHEITVEKVLPPDAGFKHPACLAGANACPPDDCGGMPGYYRMLEVLADSKHPEYRELKSWIGGKWDPTLFSADAAHAALQRLKA